MLVLIKSQFEILQYLGYVKMPRHSCHFLIKQTAKEMAGALYEEVMNDNTAYKNWKTMCEGLPAKEIQAKFIEMMWPKLIEEARKTLAQLLGMNTLPEASKAEIHEALVLDNLLKQGLKPTKMWRQ